MDVDSRPRDNVASLVCPRAFWLACRNAFAGSFFHRRRQRQRQRQSNAERTSTDLRCRCHCLLKLVDKARPIIFAFCRDSSTPFVRFQWPASARFILSWLAQCPCPQNPAKKYHRSHVRNARPPMDHNKLRAECLKKTAGLVSLFLSLSFVDQAR